jgi:hypothetical protein
MYAWGGVDNFCSLVTRVPGYTSEMYCASCEVRTEFICYIEESRPPLWSSGQSSWLKKEDVLCFLWGTNWIDICYVEESRPPPWSSGQSTFLQIQRSVFDSRANQNFWDVVRLVRSPLTQPPPSMRNTFALTSPTIVGRSVGIFCSSTLATEFFLWKK